MCIKTKLKKDFNLVYNIPCINTKISVTINVKFANDRDRSYTNLTTGSKHFVKFWCDGRQSYSIFTNYH